MSVCGHEIPYLTHRPIAQLESPLTVGYSLCFNHVYKTNCYKGSRDVPLSDVSIKSMLLSIRPKELPRFFVIRIQKRRFML